MSDDLVHVDVLVVYVCSLCVCILRYLCCKGTWTFKIGVGLWQSMFCIAVYNLLHFELKWCSQHNDIQHNDPRHKGLICETQLKSVSIKYTQHNNPLPICWMSLCWVSLCFVSWRRMVICYWQSMDLIGWIKTANELLYERKCVIISLKTPLNKNFFLTLKVCLLCRLNKQIL
jgi:hypothetical protein